MKKKIVIITLIVCFIVFMLFIFLDNPNNGDWCYKINENYQIWHINLSDISLVRKEDNSFSKVAGDYIAEFKCNDKYIFLKIANLCENSSPNRGITCESSIEEAIKKETFRYAIVNIMTDEVDDFLKKDEFMEKTKDIDFPSEWIKTKPMPEGATFDVN